MSEYTSQPDGAGWQTPVHGAQDFEVSAGAQSIPEVERVKVSVEDLRAPEEFAPGEALIVLGINVKDTREIPGSAVYGELYLDKALEYDERVKAFMSDVYGKVPEADRADIDVVVLAGEADLRIPQEDIAGSEHQRAFETGVIAVAAIKETMEMYGINPAQALTNQNGQPIATNLLDETRLMHPTDNPEGEKAYLEALMAAAEGNERKLWMMHEGDELNTIREAAGAEGPSDIADRVDHVVNICSMVADKHLEGNPDKRVVVLAIGFYDNVSPWIKKELLGQDPAKSFVPIEKGSGIVIKRGPDGAATTQIDDKTYDLQIDGLDLPNA